MQDSVKKKKTLANAGKVADFIMVTQRSVLLNLASALNDGNVSFAQFFLLGYLANENHLSMKDISTKMGHSTAAATGLVDRLEKLDYVKRFHAEDDRRKVLVKITSKGRSLVDRIRKAIEGELVSMMAAMDEREQVALGDNFLRMADSLRRSS